MSLQTVQMERHDLRNWATFHHLPVGHERKGKHEGKEVAVRGLQEKVKFAFLH